MMIGMINQMNVNPQEHHIETCLEAIDEEESDIDIQDNISESLHTTMIYNNRQYYHHREYCSWNRCTGWVATK